MATARDTAVAMVAEWRRLGGPGLPTSNAALVELVAADLKAKAAWEYRLACWQWFTYAALAATFVALATATVLVIGRAQ